MRDLNAPPGTSANTRNPFQFRKAEEVDAAERRLLRIAELAFACIGSGAEILGKGSQALAVNILKLDGW